MEVEEPTMTAFMLPAEVAEAAGARETLPCSIYLLDLAMQ